MNTVCVYDWAGWAELGWLGWLGMTKLKSGDGLCAYGNWFMYPWFPFFQHLTVQKWIFQGIVVAGLLLNREVGKQKSEANIHDIEQWRGTISSHTAPAEL